MSDLAAALKGIGPDWFSAVGTVGALLVALILFGFQAWDRRRDARDRRRAHAELVSAVMGPLDRTGVDGDHQKGRTGIDLYNSSASPVYDVVVGIVFIQGAGPTTMEEFLDRSRDEAVPITTSKVLAPGRFRVWVDGVGWTSALSGRPGAEVAFADRAGRHWIRRATGSLVELKQRPLDYFGSRGLYAPYEFQTPDRLG